MPNKTAERLRKNIDKILLIWERRVSLEVAAAHGKEKLALRNSLPFYLLNLADALSNTSDRISARKLKMDSIQSGKSHGKERAASKNYTMDQLITEYHILRQVLCDVLEEGEPLSFVERELIICSIEQAVNDAATEYTKILKDVRDRISNTLAHDLRNPLTSTRISAELVLKKLPPDDSSVPKMKLIISNMERLDQMVIGLLDASRLEAGERMLIEVTFCDFDKIIRQVIEELSLSFPNYFKLVSKGKCEGFWDESGLRRIVENLLTNAVKYGDENAPITLSLSQNENFAELSVHNLGKPISPEDVPILYEQYGRLKSSKLKTGWGLGLTMVKDMVKALNGSITLDTDKGTTFKIRLPKDSRASIHD